MQPTLKETLQKQASYAPTSKNAKDLNGAVAYFISKEMMPFQIVEKPGFLKMMKTAAPLYKVPTRQFFSRTEVPRLYNEVKADVTKRVAQGTWYAATTDLWTSSGGGGEPYISFTIHYVSPEWKLESSCLETLLFPQDHTAANILEMVENMLQEWEIKKEQVVCVTTDNASNMQKAFENFPDMWLGCFGHNLNLAITKIMKHKRVDAAVRACRHLVQGFSRSWKRKRELKAKQTALELPQKSLIHDVVTRWGSTYQMLERFLSQQQAISATLAAERGVWHLMPKDSDITVIEQVCELLGPLNQFTDALASETRVTLSAIKPVLLHVKTEILEQKDEDPALVKEMKSLMRDDLDSRYSRKAERIMDVACFIDPRFKERFSDDLESTTDNCVQEALQLAPVRVRQEEEGQSQPTEPFATPPTKATSKGLAVLLKKITATRQQRSVSEDDHRTTEEQVI